MKFSTAAVLASTATGAHASYRYGDYDSSAPIQNYGPGSGFGSGSGSGSGLGPGQEYGFGSGAGGGVGAGPYGPPAEVATPTGTSSDKTFYVTEVVKSFETYCPGPTELVHNNKTYTITEATTFTITDCPCTMTSPAFPLTTGGAGSGYGPSYGPGSGSGYGPGPGSGASPPGSAYGYGSGFAKIGTAYSTQTPKAVPFATGGGSAHGTGILPVPTSSATPGYTTSSSSPSSESGYVVVNGAGKLTAFSGAAMVGVLGIAALLL